MDISMCTDHHCPVKETCLRYTATPSMYQSYADFKAEDEKGCEYFWDNKGWGNDVKKES